MRRRKNISIIPQDDESYEENISRTTSRPRSAPKIHRKDERDDEGTRAPFQPKSRRSQLSPFLTRFGSFDQIQRNIEREYYENPDQSIQITMSCIEDFKNALSKVDYKSAVTTQDFIAMILGVSPGTLSNWKRGVVAPPIATMLFMKALKLASANPALFLEVFFGFNDDESRERCREAAKHITLEDGVKSPVDVIIDMMTKHG